LRERSSLQTNAREGYANLTQPGNHRRWFARNLALPWRHLCPNAWPRRRRRGLELSTPAEIRLPLLWIAVLSGQLRASLAATTGIDSSAEVIKYLLAGTDAVMTTSALLRHGVGHMKVLLDGLKQWMDARGFDDIRDIRSLMSQRRIKDPTAFERANYMQILQGAGTERIFRDR
jgi:hypothetical protein